MPRHKLGTPVLQTHSTLHRAMPSSQSLNPICGSPRSISQPETRLNPEAPILTAPTPPARKKKAVNYPHTRQD